jgi:hypothetical protein
MEFHLWWKDIAELKQNSFKLEEIRGENPKKLTKMQNFHRLEAFVM